MISAEQEALILRLHHAEKWPPGTIANQLGLHYSVVVRVLEQEGVPRPAIARPSKADRFIPFIRSTLEQYPRLTAARLYQMVRERGYTGKPTQFRAIVAKYRPTPPAEAFLRLRTHPGEEAQVDWGHFGKIEIGEARRPLIGFVMVLSYSRAIFLRFFPGQHLSYFLTGHEAAFQRWKGVPRRLAYDNLKSVVLERSGDVIRFHPQLVDFAGHYRYEPRPVAPYRGNEKGRVERAIRYIRDNFIPARTFRSFDDINHQADQWCATVALDRRWPEDRGHSVAEALERDTQALRPLPRVGFPCHERKEVQAGKTPYIRFDLNDYSIPHTHVRQTLVVVADLQCVRVLSGSEVIATHERSFDRGRQIEDPTHLEELAERKGHARKARQSDQLRLAVPSSDALLTQLAERQQPLGRHVQQLHTLLKTYGATKLERAIREVLEHDTPHPQAVLHVLEREREAAGEEPILPLPLPEDPRLDRLGFTPHSLDGYDAFLSDDDDDPEDPR